MKVYEVLNYFDRSRYFVSAKTKEEMLHLVDESFLEKLRKIKADGEYFDKENGEYQYDYLRHSKTKRLEEIHYTLLLEDATKPSIKENNLEGDLHKFYF